MKSYWDSSALIEAILDLHPARSNFSTETQKFTRCHALAECFSHLTGGRLGRRIDATEAATVLQKFSDKMTVVSLNARETLDALNQAKKRGVRGGAIHDFLHAYAAELHDCKKIYTGNAGDFAAVTKLEIVPA